MWLLVNGYSEEVEQHSNVGGLVQPRNWARAAPWIQARRPWAIDNDYKRFDPINFLSMLRQIRATHPDPSSSGCLFAAVPDVYADHEATLALWHKWRELVWGFDLPPAFVVQNGATVKNVPWRDMRALWRGGSSWYSGAIFIGGTTEWKFSEDAAAIVRVANRLRLWVHWGRGNSKRRIAYAKEIGCDSLDGGGFSRFRKHLAWGAAAAAAAYQPRLL